MKLDLKLGESIDMLEKAGAIISLKEDTDEYDDADLGINVNPKEYHKQKAKMTPLKERIIQAYETFISRKEKDAEKSWKKSVKYRGGGNDEEDLIENYEDRWGEKFEHKNSLSLTEFYKIMMSNYDTRNFIFDHAKKFELEGLVVGKNKFYDGNDDGDDDDDYDDFKKPSSWKFNDSVRVCKIPAAKKIYQKEIAGMLKSAKSLNDFFKKASNRGHYYYVLWDKADDKITDLVDEDKKVPQDLKDKERMYNALADAFDEWDSNMWLGQMLKRFSNLSAAKSAVSSLFTGNFSMGAVKTVVSKVTGKGKKKEEKKTAEIFRMPAIVKTMYKTFMNKMKTKIIYRAVEVDTDWVDDQLDDMEDKWNQGDKAEYLRKNHYKERMGLANVNLHAVGKSWCWSKDTSAVSGNGGDEFMLVAENTYSNIDLPMSALCAAEWSTFYNKGNELRGEEEVRVLDEFEVTVLDVYIGKGKHKVSLDREETYYRDENE
jgi:hypothetical protein